MPLTENVAMPIEVGQWNPIPQARPEVLSLLQEAFGVEFHLLNVETGGFVYRTSHQPIRNFDNLFLACRETARRGQVELIDGESPFLILAIPLGRLPEYLDYSLADDEYVSTDEASNTASASGTIVAVSVFVNRQPQQADNLAQAAEKLGLDASGIDDWTVQQAPWTPTALLRVGRIFLQRLTDRRQAQKLEYDRDANHRRIESLIQETQSLAENLSSTYEEISLLHRLTQNLKLSEGDEQLGRLALEWLGEVLPAEAVALLLLADESAVDIPGQQVRERNVLLTRGNCPVNDEEFLRIIEHLRLSPATSPFVGNASVTSLEDWPCAKIRQIVLVPLAEGDNLFGWLAAINHVHAANPESDQSGVGEFGTVEANLLSSVGAILGIHSGNIELYRQQAEMFSSIVRALTSAIDAKDRYTHGHSDRVARISVCLANQLGCDEELLDMIYLAGLLHDIGKIGIDDQVLRKPGKLSDEEYEHIKSHAEVGHRILHGLKQMDEVLPVVLHHHESWDGHGYPHQLPNKQIPLAARIVAVADSYDAMSSDRPYRKGMPEDRIEHIFREGSGKQWDPQVIEAFFAARREICEIAHSE